jgi:hypothetical protein
MPSDPAGNEVKQRVRHNFRTNVISMKIKEEPEIAQYRACTETQSSIPSSTKINVNT